MDIKKYKVEFNQGMFNTSRALAAMCGAMCTTYTKEWVTSLESGRDRGYYIHVAVDLHRSRSAKGLGEKLLKELNKNDGLRLNSLKNKTLIENAHMSGSRYHKFFKITQVE